jgi:lipopolysaccharide biosynthesis protein
MNKYRPIAMYLPQYHPIPENDEWWVKGFTEWTNCTKAKPLFKGHYQPHLPTDLGFYDLRVPEAREEQAALARAYGIYGFCYYHYWFNGRRLLERPFNEVLLSGKPDFPFCLCWANETWTRVWHGKNNEVLVEQKYSEEDDRNHIRWLCKAFEDKRYIRINNKPVFLVYQATLLPDPVKTTSIWREEALKAGIGDLYLIKVDSYNVERVAPEKIGFDAAMEFQIDGRRIKNLLNRDRLSRLKSRITTGNQAFQNNHIFDYGAYIKDLLNDGPDVDYFRYPSVSTGYDNSPRKANSKAVISIN